MSAHTHPVARAQAPSVEATAWSPGRWRPAASVSEGLANVRLSALGPLLVAVVVLVVGGALVADLRTAGAVLDAEERYLAQGGDLLVARAQGDASLDAARCAAVTDVVGVRAAAGVAVEPGAVRLEGRPESAQTVVRATAGVVDLLDLPWVGGGEVVVADALAERWQWAAGTRLRLDPAGAATLGAPVGTLTVRAVADLARLGDAASTALLVPQAPVGPVDECWVRVAPQHREDVRGVLPALLGETGTTAVQVADRLPPGALTQDAAAAYDARATRWAPVAAGAVVGLLWAVVAWTRRGRSALYASIGVPRAGAVLLRWVEGAAVVVPGCLWAAALATGVGAVTGLPVGVALGLACSGALGACAAAVTAVAVVGVWQPPTLAALKDR